MFCPLAKKVKAKIARAAGVAPSFRSRTFVPSISRIVIPYCSSAALIRFMKGAGALSPSTLLHAAEGGDMVEREPVKCGAKKTALTGAARAVNYDERISANQLIVFIAK